MDKNRQAQQLKQDAPETKPKSKAAGSVDVVGDTSGDASGGVGAKDEAEVNEAAEDCPICMCAMDDVSETSKLKCGHEMHKQCFEQFQKNRYYKCPRCQKVICKPGGNQPKSGTMRVRKEAFKLPGNERSSKGTIVIEYYFRDGVQTEEHPRPGSPYSGTERVCFLPWSKEGKRVLKLLRCAFDARLTFTIGRSATTGEENTVLWNIHHKTDLRGPYGYPDPTYLQRVTEELAAMGITDEEVEAAKTSSCAMCFDAFDSASKPAPLRCGHMMHEKCFKDFEKLGFCKCPRCEEIIADPRGNQPPGHMDVRTSEIPLPGHRTNSTGTIEITYSFKDGTQTKEHPRPGEPYSGIERKAYLPNSAEGESVLKLLQKAFDAGLLFRVGDSVSRKKANTVVWTGMVTHKTSRDSYPDHNYLQRVTKELAAVGIVKEDWKNKFQKKK